MTVWAVIYGNYFPREIDSLYTTEELAQRRADQLGGMWTIEERTVYDHIDVKAEESFAEWERGLADKKADVREQRERRAHSRLD